MDPLQVEEAAGPSNSATERKNEEIVRNNETIASGPEHKASGIKTSLHGTIYQIKLLMLFINRGMKHKYKFLLGTEVDEADKFDDLVFSYEIHKTKVYRFLQAKHRLDSSKTIKFSDLLKENKDDAPNERKTKEKGNDDFSLLKYFVSHRKIKQNEIFEGELKDFIICTNIDLDNEVLKPDSDSHMPAVEINSTEDDILDFKNFPKSKRYKFSKNTNFYKKLQTVLKNTHSEKLAASLAKAVLNKEKTLPKDEMFKCYRGWLLENVFRIETDNNGRFIMLRDDILQDSNDGDEALKNFCRTFITAIKKGKTKEQIHDIVGKTKFKIPDTFTLETKGSLSLNVKNEEIDSFLDKFVLAVKQPNDLELQNIITDEIGEDMNFINSEFIASVMLKNILEWVKDKKGRFLRSEDIEQLFKCLKQNLARIGLVGVTLAYKSKIDGNYIIFKDSVQVIKFAREFLKDKMKQVLIVYYNTQLLSAMKIAQATKNARVDSDLFFDIKTLNSLIGTATCPLEALQSEAYNHLVVDNITKLDEAGEVLKSIIEILKHHPNKSIILNIAHKSKQNAKNLLCSLSKEYDLNDEKFLTLVDAENNFCNLDSESQKKLLNQSKVIFQGKEVSLCSLLNEKEDLIRGKILSRLICNEKIEIGKPVIDDKYERVKDYFSERTLEQYVFPSDFSEFGVHDFYITYSSQINDSELDITQDIVIISEDENDFRELCTRYKGRNIHWFVQYNVKTRYIKSHNFSRGRLDLVKSDLKSYDFKGFNNKASHRIPQKVVSISNSQLPKLNRVLVLFRDDNLEMVRGYDKLIDRLIQGAQLFLERTIFNRSPSDFEHADTEYDKTNLITCLPITEVTNINIQSHETIILVSKEESDFNMLLEHYGDTVIHHMSQKWLYRCRQSQGQLSEIRQCGCKKYKYKPEEVMALPEKVVIIDAEPGMGKSVLLTHLARQEHEQQSNARLWFVKIDLVRYLKDFTQLQATNMKDVLKFLCRAVKPEFLRDVYGGEHEMYKFVYFETNDEISFNVNEGIMLIEEDFLEAQLFIRMYNSGNVVLLLDGFDEISPRFNSVVLDLIDTFKRTRLYKIWLTTRPYNIQCELENRLGVLAYKLVPLCKEEQIKMFTKFWETSLKIAINKNRVAYFVETFLNIVSHHVGLNRGYEPEFMSIPLHITMIATTYENEFLNFHNFNRFSSLIENFNLCDLYEKFLSTKLSFIYKEFEEVGLTHYYAMEEHKLVTLDNHRYLALLELFKSKELEGLLSKEMICRVRSLRSSIRDGKEKTGLILRVDRNGKPQFIHRTFAEYFAADLLASMVDPNDKRYICCRTSAVNFVYENWLKYDSKYQPLLKFLNYKLLTMAGKKSDINELIAVLNGDCRVLEKENIRVSDSFGRTALHLACCTMKWKRCLTLFKINKCDLLIQDTLFKWSPLHYAVASMGTNIVTERDNFNIDILHNAIDLQDIKGKTPIMLAFEINNQSMISFLSKFKPNLNIVDKSGHTILHYVKESKVFFDLIVNGASAYVKKDKDGNSLFDMFLKDQKWHLVHDIINKTLSTDSEHCGQSDAIKYLIKEMQDHYKFCLLSTDEFHNDNIIFCTLCEIIDVNTKSTDGETALHGAVLDVGYNCIMGNLDTVELLLDKNIDVNIQDNLGKTALHYAIECKQKLYKRTWISKDINYRRLREYETSLDIILCLLNNGADISLRDNEGKTALHYVADRLTNLNEALDKYGADSFIFSELCDFTTNLLIVFTRY